MRRAQVRTTASRNHWALVITPTVVTAALVLAACGSSSPSNSAGGHPSQEAQINQEVVSFAACMRSHGVTNFPDPTTSPRAFKNALATSSPAFASARLACKHLLPGGGLHQSAPRSQAQIAAALAFAHCMRTHGFPRFPDPTANGELNPGMVVAAGINLRQPAFTPAADSCVGVTHGFLTRADVARAVNNAGSGG